MSGEQPDAPSDDDVAFARRIAAPLRAPERLDATFEARLLARVEAAARAGDGPRRDIPRHDLPRAGAGGWRGLTSARTVRVSPLAGVAIAAGFAGLVALGTLALARGGEPAGVAAAPAPDTVRIVQFVLVAPHAAEVAVVGDFNDWRRGATPLRRAAGGGVWSVDVPLTPGRHQYAFIVDGTQWVLDPSAPTAVEDDFGTPNSVVTVGEAAS